MPVGYSLAVYEQSFLKKWLKLRYNKKSLLKTKKLERGGEHLQQEPDTGCNLLPRCSLETELPCPACLPLGSTAQHPGTVGKNFKK